MDLEIIAKILNTGVTGFAFLMLFLGFRLTSQVQAKILDHKPSDFKDIEMYREWKELIAAQLSNTRYFLIFSLIFFAGGLFLLVYESETKPKVIMSKVLTSPETLSFEPKIFVNGEKMDFEQRYSLPIPVQIKDGHGGIRVSYDLPIEEIRKLKNIIEKKEDEITNLIAQGAEGDSGW
jgi:hypothetical protein